MGNLDPTGGSLYLGDLVLRTQNLDGDAVAVEPTSPSGTRAGDGLPTPLEAAFPPEMRTTHVVVLEASQTSYGTGGASRGGADGGPTIQLDIPQPLPGHEQAVVSIDERGVTTWSFAPAAQRQPATRGGAGSRTFTIKRPPPPTGAAEPGADRSVIGDIGKQIIKVVTFPIGRAAGKVLNSFLGKWEASHQGYGVRDYGSSNYRELIPYFDGQPEKWRDLAKGRTLLMIHGTFSRAHGAFHELPPDKMAELERLYEGRVIAFDHSSISADPDQNIDWLIDKIPPGTSLDLDIVCHSRGGLVARSLTERPADRLNGRQIRVHRTALVGTVNNGTILASVARWNDLIDTLSTVDKHGRLRRKRCCRARPRVRTGLRRGRVTRAARSRRHGAGRAVPQGVQRSVAAGVDIPGHRLELRADRPQAQVVLQRHRQGFDL